MANDKPNAQFLRPVATTKNGLIKNFGTKSAPKMGLLFEDTSAICEWVFLTPDDPAISWRLEEIECLDFFVESKSGNDRKSGNRLIGPEETGEGTKEKPWINLNSVFSTKRIQCLIEKYCCLYIRIQVGGVIDYYVDGLGQSFDGRLMIEFINGTTMDINWNLDKHPRNIEGLFHRIGDAIFKNVKIRYKMRNSITKSPGQVDLFLRPVSSSQYSLFYNMNAEINLYNSVSGTNANDHASCNVDFFYNCSSINILNSYFKVTMDSRSSQDSDREDASVAHTRFALMYNSGNSFLSDCRVNASCKSYAYDHYKSDGSSFTSATSQCFGLVNSGGCVLEYCKFSLSAASSNNGKCRHSSISCALGDGSGDAECKGCVLGNANIDDNGTNGWVTNYPYTCNS